MGVDFQKVLRRISYGAGRRTTSRDFVAGGRPLRGQKGSLRSPRGRLVASLWWELKCLLQMFLVSLHCYAPVTLVPEVFLDFSSRKRSRGSREAATTSRESDEEREKNLWLPWPRISLSCRRQLSNTSNC